MTKKKIENKLLKEIEIKANYKKLMKKEIISMKK